MEKFRAKQLHGIVESLVFLAIFLTCFLLVLRTSISQESIAKEGVCAYKNERGFIGVLYDDVNSDFDTFASGNDNFNRRLYEHFLRPRAPQSYVFSPTSIAIGLAVLAIGSESGNDDILQELSYSASFPCNSHHLKQDLVTLKTNFSAFYSNEVFIDIFYDADRFRNMTGLDWSISRYADKFTIAMKKQMTKTLMHTNIKMDTSFGISKFAISTFFDLPRMTMSHNQNENNWIRNTNVSIFRIERLQSRAIVLTSQRNMSLVFLEPFSQLAVEILESRIGTFDLRSDFHPSWLEYNGQAVIKLPSIMPDLDTSFDLALPLQSFGSVSVFDRSEDFPKRAFGCDQPLHISLMFQDVSHDFNLASVFKANFQDSTGDDDAGQAEKNVSIRAPYLFYIKSTTPTSLVHLFGRVGHDLR